MHRKILQRLLTLSVCAGKRASLEARQEAARQEAATRQEAARQEVAMRQEALQRQEAVARLEQAQKESENTLKERETRIQVRPNGLQLLLLKMVFGPSFLP